MADRPISGPRAGPSIGVHTTSGAGVHTPAPAPDSLVERLRVAADYAENQRDRKTHALCDLLTEAATEVEHLRWAVGCLLRKGDR